ncbi:hypothetical protein RHMOL_Rhmol13G0187800 [Rhododendron molle]|uniref:Uncharacterized protein n=1 Tax=Rhododendron molle TaxID=49168 RepID=A0ACC0L952_RHOML|nr:hypothetical protein RHMOL_Rhmol13G0187800 [Rhododendron molle]
MVSDPPQTGVDDATKTAAAIKAAEAAAIAEKAAKAAEATKAAEAANAAGATLHLQISEPSILNLQWSQHEEENHREESKSSEEKRQNRKRNSKPPLEKSSHELGQILKMQNQIEGLMKQVKAQTPATVEELVQNMDSPFTSEVMGRPLPKKFKMPQLETFNGSTDLLDRLETYKSLMHLQAVPDKVTCRAFPVTLKGSARA